MAHRPRILVTRSPRQASELAEQLRALGAEAILIPTIETVDPADFAPLDAALRRLTSMGGDPFDWLIFTSANAVEAFRRRLMGANVDMDSGLKVAAIGPATARTLEGIGLRADLQPPQAVAESLAAALLPEAVRGDGSAGRFLLVRAEEAREHLPETLRGAGGEVTIAAAYRTVMPTGSVEAMRELFDGSELPEAITFTSSSTARNLFSLLDAAGVRLPEDVVRASIGPITSATLRELGYPAHVEATVATVSSLAESVVAYLKQARRGGG